MKLAWGAIKWFLPGIVCEVCCALLGELLVQATVAVMGLIAKLSKK